VDVMPRAGPKGTDEIDRLARTLNQVAESRSHEEDYDRTQLEVARKPASRQGSAGGRCV